MTVSSVSQALTPSLQALQKPPASPLDRPNDGDSDDQGTAASAVTGSNRKVDIKA